MNEWGSRILCRLAAVTSGVSVVCGLEENPMLAAASLSGVEPGVSASSSAVHIPSPGVVSVAVIPSSVQPVVPSSKVSSSSSVDSVILSLGTMSGKTLFVLFRRGGINLDGENCEISHD